MARMESGLVGALRRFFRTHDQAASSMVTFIVGTSAFFVSSAVLIHFVAEPPGGTSNLDQSDLKSRAVNALELLLGTSGTPSTWSTSASSIDALQRLGLLETGTTIRLDPAKYSALANGSFLNPSTVNGAVDYDEARTALGLAGYNFHIRSYPLFEPFTGGSYGIEDMEDFRVAYIGHWDSALVESEGSKSERYHLDELPIGFTNLTRTSLIGPGDAFKDDKFEMRDYLAPLLGAAPAQTVINKGTGSDPEFDFNIVPASDYAALVPLTATPSRALALSDDSDEDGDYDLGYKKSRELRSILGVANMSDLSTALLTWDEYVNTGLDDGDYGFVEVSTDSGTTWTALTNTVALRSQDSSTSPFTSTSLEPRSVTISSANCATCPWTAEVWVAFHWVADGDATTGNGWVVDNVQLSNGVTPRFSKDFETPEYDMLIVGSAVDQNAMTSADIKYAIRDYVEAFGGRLLVLGGETNVNWLQPLFHAGIREAGPNVAAPDTTHPLLTVPNQLDYQNYDDEDNVWKFSAAGSEALFNMVVGSGTDEHTLSVSARSAFGTTDGDGVVMLTTYLPHTMTSDQAKKFFANVLTYGRYHRLYMEVGPSVPDGVAVATAQRSALMDKTTCGCGSYLEMAFVIYVWPGAVTSTVVPGLLDPSAPGNLTAEATQARVFLNWTEPSYSPTPITTYRIWRGGISGTETLLATMDATLANGTSWIDLNVVEGSTYYYNVTASNSAGESDSSLHVSATPYGLPEAPSSLAATGAFNTVTLTWDAPSDTGGIVLTGYTVYTSTDGVTFTPLTSIGPETTYVHSGLANLTTNYYRITANNSAGEGPASNIATATTWSLPLAPTTLVATGVAGGIQLSWSSATSTPSVSGHNIYRSSLLAGPYTLLAASGSNTTFTDATPAASETWYYTVTATSSAGESGQATAAFATRPTTPTQPLTLVATAGVRQISLSWLAPASNGGLAVTGYTISRSADGSSWATLATLGTNLSFVDATVPNGTTYHYRVAAINGVGTGADSSSASATSHSAPDAPTLVSATPIAGKKITLLWTAPGSNGGTAITGYEIWRKVDTGSYSLLTTTGVVTTYTDSGLTTGLTYTYKVAAVNAVGTGAFSGEQSGIST